MVVATIGLTTLFGDTQIPVEVLGKGPRAGTAWVQALGGLEPFTKMSHGGPLQDDTAVIPLPALQDVHIEEDPIEKQDTEQDEEPQGDTPILAPDWFLESAYPQGAKRPGGRLV